MKKAQDAFRTISEVAEWLETPPHVLRFWESKFPQIKPVKRAGGRRYYRPSDMMLIGGIKKLLHQDGLTINSAKKLLQQEGVKHVAQMSPPLDVPFQGFESEQASDAAQDDNVVPITVESTEPFQNSFLFDDIEAPIVPKPAKKTKKKTAAKDQTVLAALSAADPAIISANRPKIKKLVTKLEALRERMVQNAAQ